MHVTEVALIVVFVLDKWYGLVASRMARAAGYLHAGGVMLITVRASGSMVAEETRGELGV